MERETPATATEHFANDQRYLSPVVFQRTLSSVVQDGPMAGVVRKEQNTEHDVEQRGRRPKFVYAFDPIPGHGLPGKLQRGVGDSVHGRRRVVSKHPKGAWLTKHCRKCQLKNARGCARSLKFTSLTHALHYDIYD